jgi:F-type H+-transporting ATPase subunit delta
VSAVTSRYARAFVDVVLDHQLDAAIIVGELRSLARIAQSSLELRRVWENPAIPSEQKRGLLDAIVARQAISRPVRNFIAVLIDHSRINVLDQVIKDFEHELDARLGFAEAQITTVRDLNEAERRTLEAQVQKLTGKKVRASYSRDESILGGAIVQVGSTIYDGSVRGQLQKIREQLAGESS